MLGATRYAAGLIVALAVPLGAITLLAGLVPAREQWAVAGLMLLAGAIATILWAPGRGSAPWIAAAQVLLACSLFMNAALEQRRWTLAWSLLDDSIRVIAVACAVLAAVLMLRSGGLSFRRPSRPGRGPMSG